MRDGTFLQSTAWETFEERAGFTTLRIEGALVVVHRTPLGIYWYVGRATLSADQIKTIADQAKATGVLFVRIDPLNEIRDTRYEIRTTLATAPPTTLVLDLAPTAEELLSSFHEKTRYNIRLAERKGVVIEESSDPTHRDFRAFIELGKRTGSRQGIRFHDEAHYRLLLESLQTKEITASIVTAHWQNRPLAANLMLWAGDTAYYLHGASDHEQRQLMAPHLLQWACIQRAKERSATAYDFWGIAPAAAGSQKSNVKGQMYEADASHPWAGITRFKLGFGGNVVSYPESVDLILNPTRYRLYQAGRALRRFIGRVV